MLGNMVGAGMYLCQPDGIYPMGHQMEVHDAELYGIQQAAEYALQNRKRLGLRYDVWIFVDNQTAIMRIRTLKPGTGQKISIALAHISTKPTALKLPSPSNGFLDTLM